MNKVILLGNLTRDIELKYLPNGTAVGKSAIAVNKRIKTQNGETKDETMFIDLTFWGRTAEIVQQYFHKGSKILIEGKLIQESWTAQDGSKKTKHTVSVESIDFVDSKSSNENASYSDEQQSNYQQYNNKNNASTSNSYASASSSAKSSAYTQQKAPQHNKAREETLPSIDIDDMDDRVPF